MNVLRLAVLLLLPAAAARAQDAGAAPVTKVAVFELKATGIDESVALNLTETFTTEAGRVPGYHVVSRTEIKDLLGYEMEKQALGCGDEEKCFTEIGGALGVQLLVTGSIGRIGETFVINLKLIDVKAATTKHRVGESILGRVELLPEFIRIAAWRLFQQPVPRDVDASYQLTRAKLEEEIARKAGDAGRQAEAEKARAEAEKAKAEAEKAKAETERIRLARQKKGPTAAAPVAATAPPPADDHWAGTAKSVSIAVGVLGLLGGAGMTILSVLKQGEVGDPQPASDGGTVYDGDGSRSAAGLATLAEQIALPCYIVGGVGIAAAIVFAIIEPDPPTSSAAVRIVPSPLGLALEF